MNKQSVPKQYKTLRDIYVSPPASLSLRSRIISSATARPKTEIFGWDWWSIAPRYAAVGLVLMTVLLWQSDWRAPWSSLTGNAVPEQAWTQGDKPLHQWKPYQAYMEAVSYDENADTLFSDEYSTLESDAHMAQPINTWHAHGAWWVY